MENEKKERETIEVKASEAAKNEGEAVENEPIGRETGEKEVMEQAPAPKRRTLGFIIGGVLLVALLIGSAFVAGRLLNRPSTSTNAGGGRGRMVMGSDSAMSEVEIEQPKELPDRAPDVTGVMDRVENSSIFVTSSSGPISVMVGPEGADIDVGEGNGDTTTIEIVVTRDTLLYKDATQMPGIGETAPDKIEQKVAPITLDELKGQALVTAWGERKGDRLIAEVVFCSIFPEAAE